MNYIWWSISSALFFAATFLLRKLAVRTIPFNLVLLGSLLLKESLTLIQFFGAILAAVGIILMVK